jgi:hypothetical protein
MGDDVVSVQSLRQGSAYNLRCVKTNLLLPAFSPIHLVHDYSRGIIIKDKNRVFEAKQAALLTITVRVCSTSINKNEQKMSLKIRVTCTPVSCCSNCFSIKIVIVKIQNTVLKARERARLPVSPSLTPSREIVSVYTSPVYHCNRPS